MVVLLRNLTSASRTLRRAQYVHRMATRTGERPHPRNTHGCCDGSGQVWHNASGDPDGPGALTYVTLCPNGCASKAWDAECEAAEAAHQAKVAQHGGNELYWLDELLAQPAQTPPAPDPVAFTCTACGDDVEITPDYPGAPIPDTCTDCYDYDRR